MAALVNASNEPAPDGPKEPTTAEKLRGLRWSIASNSFNTIFVQYTFFGSVFVLFLDALNLDKGQIGFLLSLLPFAGLISLVASARVHRSGYKRTYIAFWGLRTIVSMGLLATPWVVNQFGPQITLIFVAVIISLFSLARAVGMTASLPWVQEYVPDSVRGKYTANNNIVTSSVGFVAIMVGSFLLNRNTGLSGFMLLMGMGIVAGFLCTWLASFIPGGAPDPQRHGESSGSNLRGALQDRRFVQFLIGVGLLTLATVPLNSFVPLYMREKIGLDTGSVVLLQIGSLSGGILFSYAWGWAADRYGSKPVMLWGLMLRAILPLLWLTMPRQSDLSLYFALGIALILGAADMGWGIGSARLLYAGIVPPAKRSDYLGIYNAWTGVVGGSSQLFGGWLLLVSAGLSGSIFFLPVDQYLPIFALGSVLPLLALLVLNRIHSDEVLGMGAFAGIFFRGNPFLAMTSMMRFHLARTEEDTVRMTEKLSVAKSPLAVDELLEALNDPRFNVRFEAIVSMARMPSDPRLTEALIEILHGSELALSVVAAWALGRSGTEEAHAPLCQALDSPYRSIQAHSARALGALGNREVIPLLMERLNGETDKGLQMAYASALGNLSAHESVRTLLALLAEMENEGARMELGLSVARIVGEEQDFVSLLRGYRNDPGTTLSQEITGLRRRLSLNASGAGLLNECAATFALGNLEKGADLFRQILNALSTEPFNQTQRQVLTECASQLAHPPLHPEYLLLPLTIFHEIR